MVFSPRDVIIVELLDSVERRDSQINNSIDDIESKTEQGEKRRSPSKSGVHTVIRSALGRSTIMGIARVGSSPYLVVVARDQPLISSAFSHF